MEYTITHKPENKKFTTVVDAHLAFVKYSLEGGVMSINSTFVPKDIEGRGIAAALMKGLLEYARESGLKAKPVCSYAVTYMKRHPEYSDLM